MQRIVFASIIAMGCTIAVAAQGGMAAGQSTDKDKMAKGAAAKSVTVTGCVAEAGGHFMLNNATMADQTGAPMSYALTGGTLKPHVGHKVEVTGMMSPKMATDGMSKGTMGKDSTMAKDTMAKDGAMAKDSMKHDMSTSGSVVVKSLKMVAATCS